MDAKSEAVMKSSSSTVASETSTSKSSTSVVVSKKAISSEKVVASKLITSGMGVGIVDAIEAVGSGGDSGSLLQAADQSIISLPGATDVLSGRMSNLVLAEELNANEAIKSTSLASSIKESSTASSAVLNKQSEGEQDATAEVTVKLASTPAAAAESPADAAAESETKTVTVKKVVVVAEESADQADGNEIEEVVEEVVEEEEGEEQGTEGGSATTTTVTVVTVKKTSDGSDAADGASASTANGSAETTTTTTTKTTTVHKSTTVEEPRQEGEESEKPKVTPAIETTPPTPQAEEKPAVAVVEVEAEPKAAPKAEQTETNVEEEEEDIEESVDSEDDEEEEASEVEDQNAQTTTATTTNDKPKVEDQVDSAEKATAAATESAANTKQAELNNQIKDIISDIDSNIKEEENIAHLKQQELALLKKQQELAKQIEQQQLLANQLAAQNQLKQQELQQQQYRLSQQQQLPQQQPQQQQLYGDRVSQLPRPQTELLSQSLPPQTKSSSYETYEESQNENGFTRKSFKSEESSNVSKTIDLRKIFTPATDAPEIVPKNRKLYASSAFYSPSLHPTVEDQVELARRISHSLSDISNHTSKGQSMYVNRKKRSVKWVHEGSGQEEDDLDYEEDPQASKENTNRENQGDQPSLEKLPLKLVMNPRGQMRDYNSVSDSLNIETGLLSPDNCAELISALQLQKGRGAELFAKRRRKAENWVVDETNAGTQSPSGLPDYQQYQPKPPTSPNLLPAYSDAGKHRVQLNLHQEQMIDKYAKPGLKVVKSPWEAALETGSASAAFVEDTKLRSHTPTPSIGGAYSPAPAPQFSDSHGYGAQPHSFAPTQSAATPYGGSSYQQPAPALNKLPQANQYQHSRPAPVNPQRELAYKPSIAQGWKAPGVELPRGLYVPKEIPLDSYAPPPAVSSTQQNYGSPSWNSGSNIGQSQPWQQQQQQQVSSAAFPKESTPYIPPSGNSYAPPSGNSYAPPSGNSYAPPSGNSYAPPSGNSYTPASNVGFPLSKPVQSGGFSSSVPPKQQLYGPTSYQKVAPTTSQGAPPVSFNPSPIPYEKLSKFENPDPSPRGNGLYSPQRHLNVRGSSRVRNLSPAPFGARSPVSYGSPAAQSYSPRPSSTQQQYGSPYEGGYDTGAPAQSGFSSANYAQGPTFNSTARGWGGVGGAGHNQQRFSQPKPAIASAGGLPYSDF